MAKTTTTKRDLARFDASIARWENAGRRRTDADIARLYQEDVRDLRAIRRAIAAGRFARAADMIWHLDTVVAERVPARLCNYVFDQAGW